MKATKRMKIPYYYETVEKRQNDPYGKPMKATKRMKQKIDPASLIGLLLWTCWYFIYQLGDLIEKWEGDWFYTKQDLLAKGFLLPTLPTSIRRRVSYTRDGTSFQSSPKISRMLITVAICIQHPTIAVLLIVCFHMTSWRPYLCPKTMKRRPRLCPKPVLWEFNSFVM